ncbi:MAG TPA: RNA polymerase sigma factor [Bryobacteraceae bacterium]|jgi:RNA polymerase sigma-70 factor (ECF subfamily)
MDDLSDEQLIDRWRAGQASPNAGSFLDELFRRHRSRVAAWCYRITGEADSAADLAQDVFLKAFQRLDSFRSDSRFTTWLYSIARNHCLDQLRARALQPAESADSVLEEIADGRLEEFSASLERRQSEELVRRLIRESLDETETKIMTLHYVDEVPLDAITRLIGLTNQSGAKAYIVSARRKLNRALEKWRRTSVGKGGKYGI